MEIRIGILNAPRELSFESSQSAEEITTAVSTALDGGSPYLRLADTKGSIYLVPVANLAYVELGSEESRRIGFVG
ncbi:DUF3107 domain-containing protein [Leifsonia sp. Root112D2]|uniref:DUF3107 domain-containing protein n=1 Tax=Leifsonia sp. Root112D2 TaxID=1736426 RepID=UPI0006FA7AD4|nr:DUF3107 domain-containing protein [Leifsonia sp. Root112D2]KQV07575.1 ATP-binding protein [Leifsonia sp. Root112D2]